MLENLRFPDSRIRSQDVQRSEKWIGHLLAPAVIFAAYSCMSGTYLNQFYVDVLRLGKLGGGMFLVLLPIVSRLLNIAVNIAAGQLIDRTRTAQGKARPWLLICAPLLAVTGAMLYLIPRASLTVQAVYIGVSYNLFFSIVFAMYDISRTLLVPRSTREPQQRDSVAMFSSIGQSMLPGMLVYVIFPTVILPFLGVSRERWALVMCIISAFMLPGVIMQYFFTRERVEPGTAQPRTISMTTQLRACLANRSWVVYFLIILVYQFCQGFFSNVIVFYSNWVLGSYNDGVTLTLLNVVGQAPLGLGVFLVWPAAKRLGKLRTLAGGMLLAAAACLPVLYAPQSMPVVLASLAVRSFGMLPSYLFAAMLAEAMDDVESRSGFRCDGLSAAVQSVIFTFCAGAATGVFNLGLSASGYVPPSELTGSAQSASVRHFLTVSFALVPAVCFLLIGVLALCGRKKRQGDDPDSKEPR